jgi:DnaJ family protein B protein 13
VTSLEAKKAIYDQYGEDILKEGVPDGKGKIKGGYKFGGNTFEIFEKFFGTSNPFSDIFDNDGRDLYGSMFGGAIGGANEKKPGEAGECEVTLQCTLKEFYQGCMKKFEYER